MFTKEERDALWADYNRQWHPKVPTSADNEAYQKQKWDDFNKWAKENPEEAADFRASDDFGSFCDSHICYDDTGYGYCEECGGLIYLSPAYYHEHDFEPPDPWWESFDF